MVVPRRSRRVLFCAGAGVLIVQGLAFATAVAGAQLRPPPGRVMEIEEKVRELAAEKAEDVLMRARATTVGAVSPETNLVIRRWDQAIRLWKKEKGAGAAPLLAEGVLLDCLGRLQGVKTRKVSTEVALPPPFAKLVEQRPGRAAKAFEAALKIDPALIEARMRAARIRAPDDSEAALKLERLADEQADNPFGYLAAISRAEVARAQADSAGAIHWYERALEIYPRSAAATIALSILRPTTALAFEVLDTGDLYYTYPCRVLTPDVDAALAERVRNVVLK